MKKYSGLSEAEMRALMASKAQSILFVALQQHPYADDLDTVPALSAEIAALANEIERRKTQVK